MSFVILLGLSTICSALVATEVLTLRLQARVDASLRQEVLELEALVQDGRDPRTGEEFASASALFDVYLSRNVTSSGEAVVTFVDGAMYAADLDRYPLSELPAADLGSWSQDAARSGSSVPGVTAYETPLGEGRATSHAFTVGGQDGLFVVTALPAGELAEISEIRTWGLLVSLAFLGVATAIAWPVAGRVLEPVRQLTETARSISESDMSQRVPVATVGDAADMARSFNAMLDRLEAVLDSQREFVRTAGHEMRDPLAICRGHLELLDPTAPDAEWTIALVLDEVSRMSRLVGDLEILANAEQRDFLRLEPTALDLLTHEIVAKATVTGDRRWRLDAAADVVVDADRHRLTEAVMNLVHNAVMHTGPGDTVAVGSSATESEWQLWVRDSGVGLPDDADLFEPYVRGEAARARYQGAGLGLSIVRLIAQSHGGRVVVDGLPGLGATFTIVVPRDQGVGPADTTTSAPDASPTTPSELRRPGSTS
ncbi:MAG TPA: HAMP domain-containing sensor histidine kinase [Ornithinibacter sp.]|nr:HAMP domain-containing sensor histidine kinase [Ornithinibacter sp.]